MAKLFLGSGGVLRTLTIATQRIPHRIQAQHLPKDIGRIYSL